MILDAMFTALSANRFKEVREASKKVVQELEYETVAALARDVSALINNPAYRVMIQDVHDVEISSKPDPIMVAVILHGKLQAPHSLTQPIYKAIEHLYQQRQPDGQEGLERLKSGFAASQQNRGHNKHGTQYPHASELTRSAELRIKALGKKGVKTIDVIEKIGYGNSNSGHSTLSPRTHGRTQFKLDELSKLDDLCTQNGIPAVPSLTCLYFHQCHTNATQSWRQANSGDKPLGNGLTALRESVGWKQLDLAQAWAHYEHPDLTDEAFTKKTNSKKVTINGNEKEAFSSNRLPLSEEKLALITGLLLEEQQRLADTYGAEFTPFIDQSRLKALEVRRQEFEDTFKIYNRRAPSPTPHTRTLERTFAEPLIGKDHAAQQKG